MCFLKGYGRPTQNGRPPGNHAESPGHPHAEEAQGFPDIVANEEEPYKTFFALDIYTGCRRGELLALKWSDFTADGYEGVMTDSRSRSMIPGKGIVEGTTKNGRSRKIFISDGPFHKRAWEPMHPDTFTKYLRRLYNESGFLREYHLHTLRHSNASLLIANGVDVATVAGLLGHAQPSTTLDIYTHAFDKNKKAASETLQQGLEI